MESLLALLAAICIIWACSRVLKKLSVFFNDLGTALENRKRSVEYIRHDTITIVKNLKKMNKKIDTIKDSQFRDRVRQEIDELTK
jgi:hypothetical protein